MQVEEARRIPAARWSGIWVRSSSSSARTVAIAASKRADFLADLVRRHRVMRDFEPGVRHQVRVADGDAAGHRMPCMVKLM